MFCFLSLVFRSLTFCLFQSMLAFLAAMQASSKPKSIIQIAGYISFCLFYLKIVTVLDFTLVLFRQLRSHQS